MTDEVKLPRKANVFSPSPDDQRRDLSYLDRSTPPTPRTFAQTKAWATSKKRRQAVPTTDHFAPKTAG